MQHFGHLLLFIYFEQDCQDWSGLLEPTSGSLALRWNTPWMGCQYNTGLHAYTFSPRINLEYPVHLTACFWEMGGIRRTHRKRTQTWGEHAKLHSQQHNIPSSGLNLRPWSCEAAVLPASAQTYKTYLKWKWVESKEDVGSETS